MSAKDIERLAHVTAHWFKDADDVGGVGDISTEGSLSYIDVSGVDCGALARAILQAMREPGEGAVLAICHKAAQEQTRSVAVHRKDAADLVAAYIDYLLAD